MPLSPVESPQQSIKRYQPVTQSWLISKASLPLHRLGNIPPGRLFTHICLVVAEEKREKFLKAMQN